MFDVYIGGIHLPTLVVILSVTVLLPIQLLLCFRVRCLLLRLIPEIVLGVLMAVCGVMCAVVTGWDGLVFVVLLLYLGAMLGMCALAWIIWAIVYWLRRKK